jgi:hypothetical protein
MGPVLVCSGQELEVASNSRFVTNRTTANIPNATPRTIEMIFRMTGESVEPPKPTMAATPPHQKAALGGAFHMRLRMLLLLDIVCGYPSAQCRKPDDVGRRGQPHRNHAGSAGPP